MPAGHGVTTTLPAGQYPPAGQPLIEVGVGQILPAVQVAHESLEFLPSAGLYVPIGHGVGALLCSAQYAPTGQVCFVALVAQKLPRGHTLQDELVAAPVTLP